MASTPYPPDSLVHRSKRRGGALSCAECRRLKLKCSRVFPCSNCVKKGCGPICPDGSLTTGKGNRFVLANTEDLHDKIGLLSSRVRQLEDALSESHSRNSLQPHPLLSEELLQIKRPLERERLDSQPQKDTTDNADAINALGSLSLSERGKSTFFGSAANSWYLLKNEEGSEEEELSTDFRPPIPTDVPWLAQSFPFSSSVTESAESIRASLVSFLPPEPQARRLCDIYYRHAAWMYTPISNKDFFETIYRPVYGQDLTTFVEDLNSHSLAVFFMVLAMGSLMDLDLPAHSPQAIQYYQLGRAALAIKSVFEEQSIPGIQALLIMCHFMFWNDEGARWVVMGIVVKLAQSVGLHRDSGKWNLDSEETYRRRCLLWEIFVYDSWQSLTYGRPPSFATAHVDTKMPHEGLETPSDGEMTFGAWKHTFASQVLAVVHDQAFGARPPSYKTLQELDKKVRSYYVPPSLQVPGFGGTKIGPEVDQPTIELTLQRYIAFAIKEITLFYMHRGFFAQALEDNPNDPMGSKYAQSVLAAYTSACSFVGLVESLFKQHPALTERIWFLFTHVFSCSIVLGSIAVKSEMALAPSALSHLESAYQLFSRVSESSRTSKIMAVLLKLKERAHASISKARGQIPLDLHHRGLQGGPQVKIEGNDELAGLGGMTRLVSRRGASSLPSSPSSNSGSSPVSQPASPPLSQDSIYSPIHDSQWQSYVPMHQEYSSMDYSVYSPTHSAMSYDSHSMSLDVMPNYYGYGNGNGNGNGQNVRVTFGQYSMQPSLSNDFATPVDHDPQVSWSNFMAPYKQI